MIIIIHKQQHMHSDILNLQIKEQNRKDHPYQCGECGKCFVNENDTESHVKKTHTDTDKTIEKMRKRLEEAHAQMDKLRKKNEVLIKANVAFEKESTRNKLALAESIYEMNELKKKTEKVLTTSKSIDTQTEVEVLTTSKSIDTQTEIETQSEPDPEEVMPSPSTVSAPLFIRPTLRTSDISSLRTPLLLLLKEDYL